MGVDLQYNLTDFTTIIDRIRDLSSSLSTDKNKFYDGFQKLRTDWVSIGSSAFFESLDISWLTGVNECIEILNDLADALEDVKKKYEMIEPEAIRKLTF